MAQTVEGAKKAVTTTYDRYGKEFFQHMGYLGGKKSKGGGFTGKTELAKLAGKIGGLRRGEQTPEKLALIEQLQEQIKQLKEQVK